MLQIRERKYNLDEKECERLFLIGLLHDVGYKFCNEISEHPLVGYELIEESLDVAIECIKLHGNIYCAQTTELRILNEADLSVDFKGNIVGVKDRLNDIQSWHGEDFDMYLNPCKLAKKLGLI